MVVQRRKKVVKYRAHTTHGGGHRKKRRGAGSRGGRGNAGTGKRAGHKKAGISRKLGHKGFTSKTKQIKAVGLSYFTKNKINLLLKKEKITKEGELFVIDLAKLGYQKLLSTGNTTFKLKISVEKFTPKAEEKIKLLGGEIVKSPTDKENQE